MRVTPAPGLPLASQRAEPAHVLVHLRSESKSAAVKRGDVLIYLVQLFGVAVNNGVKSWHIP